MIIAYLAVIALLYIVQSLFKTGDGFRRVFLPIVVIVLLIIIMGGTSNNPDYDVYRVMYSRGDQYKALGFQTLMTIAKMIGFDYVSFRILVAVLGFALIFYSVRTLTNQEYIFWILYLVYPFCFDVVQLRNFLALAFMFLGTALLVTKEGNLLPKVAFVGCVLIAASMQVVAVVYLPILCIGYFRDKIPYRIILLGMIILSFFLGLNREIALDIINRYGSFILNDETGGANYLRINNRYGWVINWSEQFLNYGLIVLSSRYIISNRSFFNQKQLKYTYLLLGINEYMFLFMPLFALDENYTRIIRNILVLNLVVYTYCAYIGILKNSVRCRAQRLVLSGGPFVFAVGYQLVMLYLMYSSYSLTIFFPLLLQNDLL